MIGMTTGAIFAAFVSLHNARVISASGGNPLPDFGVAAQAFETRRAGSKDMAGRAFRGAA